MAENWSKQEVEIIVADYFQMLTLEIEGIGYSKAHHNRELQQLMPVRSRPSIEFKHRNISAVMAKFGLPYINGYKPAWNYQGLLEGTVIEYLQRNSKIEKSFERFATAGVPANPISLIEFEKVVESPPERNPLAQESELIYKSPVKVNYLEAEQVNKVVGESGEKIVYEYERWRLLQAGKDSLADKIEWVSQTQGDGLGFDILSKNANGTDRFIEVKSTKLTKEAPFYFTKHEYDFAFINKSAYFLYRVFNLKHDPKLFIVAGAFDDFCNYQPIKFKGYF